MSRRSRIADVRLKTGSASPLAFVTVEHEISSGETLLVREIQNLVYMEIPKVSPPPKASPAGEPVPEFRDVVPTDEVLLFRYSALTRNSHRIHYDADYARAVERYAGLLVHGPLTATLLQWFAQTRSRRPIRAFTFRGQAPLFAGDPINLEGTSEDGALAVAARKPSGVVGMTGRAEF